MLNVDDGCLFLSLSLSLTPTRHRNVSNLRHSTQTGKIGAKAAKPRASIGIANQPATRDSLFCFFFFFFSSFFSCLAQQRCKCKAKSHITERATRHTDTRYANVQTEIMNPES